MLDVVNLALPFFGLIFLGFACGRIKRIPDSGMSWMNFFIVYVSLPAMFYRILATTPLGQFAWGPFIVTTTLSTFTVFVLSFSIAMAMRRGNIAESAIAGLAGGYGNIGYMGPGLALATLGAQASAPVALIFCFDQLLLFSLVPMLMAIAGTDKKAPGATVLEVVRRIFTHPLMLASGLGVLSAAVRFEPPVGIDRLLQFLQNAAAPSALFALGVTVALRPLDRMPWEVPPLVAIKLVLHPAVVLALLMLFGPFEPLWVYTAVLMTALPPALNVFVFARQYDAYVPEASSSVMVGTVVSVVTLTTVMWLVKTHNLPIALPGGSARRRTASVQQGEVGAQQQQAEQKAQPEHVGAHPQSHPLADDHADDRRHQRQQRQRQVGGSQLASAGEVDGHRHGRHGERQALRLDHVVAFQPDRLEIGHGRNHEHAGGRGDRAGHRADHGPEPPFQAGGDREADLGQSDCSIDHQSDAERLRRAARRLAGQEAAAEQQHAPCPGADAGQHRP
jgi:malonate transporter and related proteins